MSKTFRAFDEGADLLLRLPCPVLFRYIAEVDPSGATRIGFIAQELAACDERFVSRGAVAWQTEPALHVQYDALVALLINVVRQHEAELAALRYGADPVSHS